MGIPTQPRQWAERLAAAVETAPGSGHFVFDGRLVVDWAEQKSNGVIAKARVFVRIDDDLSPGAVVEFYHPDRRIAIRLGETVVFDGYPMVRRFEQRTKRARGESSLIRRFVFDVVHSSHRAQFSVAAQVYGRYVRDAKILDRMAAGDASAQHETVHAVGLSCVFNPNGRGNCSADPILVDNGAGGAREIHIFTDDLDSTTVPWTFAKALRYLLHFHSGKGEGPAGGDFLAATDSIASVNTSARANYSGTNPLVFRLLDEPFDVSVEGMSLLQALRTQCLAAKIHFAAESDADAERVTTRWRFWASEAAPVRQFSMKSRLRTSVGADVDQASDLPVRERLIARGGGRASLTWDASAARSKAIVIGGVRHFVIRAELFPGWLPEADLDNVPMGSRSAAKSMALSDADIMALGASAATNNWFRKYHRQGDEFIGHRDVARVWVLNETGEYKTQSYGREGAFSIYAPFDFSFFSGSILRRRRPLVGVATEYDPIPRIRVEVSFDNGETWYAQLGNYEMLTDRAGLRFTLENPMKVCSPYIATDHLWNALVDQSMRVRVTAAIASDDRVVATSRGRFAPSSLASAQVVLAPDRARCLCPTEGVDADVVTYDESARATAMADDTAQAREGQAIYGDVTFPWLDTTLRVGDRVSTLEGIGLPTAVARPPRDAHPMVTAIRYGNSSDDYGTTVSFAYGPSD